MDEIIEEIEKSQITVELIESEKDRTRWNKLIGKHHYLKEHRMVGESLRYVALQNGEWIALLGWSSAAFHLRPRDAWIGWSAIQRQARRPLVACNARFVLLKPKSASPGCASQILSRNLRRLSSDWLKHYGHPIALAETFVDPERFEGTCYRAANWIEIGVTKGFGRSRLDFYQIHDKPKAIFVYPLVAQAREILSAPVLPADWAPYERVADRKEYPLNGQQTKSLLQALEEGLTDPRYNNGRIHRNVASIVAIATAAMIAGNNTLLD
ncbi:MAG: Druantia anti-phage system protein DruA, partial [Candidatus Acidiferrales bacterium]